MAFLLTLEFKSFEFAPLLKKIHFKRRIFPKSTVLVVEGKKVVYFEIVHGPNRRKDLRPETKENGRKGMGSVLQGVLPAIARIRSV